MLRFGIKFKSHRTYRYLTDIDLRYLQPPKKRFEKIKMAFQQTGAWQLTPTREILGEDFSYRELRLVRLSLKQKINLIR